MVRVSVRELTNNRKKLMFPIFRNLIVAKINKGIHIIFYV